MKITITRHSKTLWNKEKRLQGCKDSPLSPEGMDNILALKEHIKNNHYDAICSSPIKRAYDTAKLLFDNQPIITDERIREMNFGLLEGQKIDEIPEEYKKAYHDLWCHPEISNGIPEGETYDEIEERVKDFLNDLVKKPYDNVFIVTHGFCFTIIMATIMNLDRKDYIKVNSPVVDGCSETIVVYSNGAFTVEVYGNNNFLPHQSNESFSK